MGNIQQLNKNAWICTRHRSSSTSWGWFFRKTSILNKQFLWNLGCIDIQRKYSWTRLHVFVGSLSFHINLLKRHSLKEQTFYICNIPWQTVNFSLTMYCVKKHLPAVYFECQLLISLRVPQLSYWRKPGTVPTCLLLRVSQ